MALDLYVGTMSRFYRREWENVVQRMSREQGIQYNVIYAGGTPEPPPPAEEIRDAVKAWCGGISEGLKSHGIGPVEWDEDDSMPYFTDRPSWEGYRALLVWAAHSEHPDLPIPEFVPESWVDDPAYEKSVDRDFRSRYLSILRPEFWIPTDFPFVFEAPTLVSERGCIGSVFTLKQELDDLHEATAQKLHDLKRPTCSGSSRGAQEKPSFLGRLFGAKSKQVEHSEPRLAETAEFAVAIFRELAAKACDQRLPMLLSF